jgi:hypothetical protein
VVLDTLALYEYAFMAITATAALLLSIAWGFNLGPYSGEARGHRSMRRWAPVALIIAIFCAVLSPPLYLEWAGGVLLVILAIVFLQKLFTHRIISLPMVATYAAIVALGVFFIATLDRVWLPAEIVTLNKPIAVNLQHSNQTYRHPVAFIVSDANGWAMVLVNWDRYLVWLKDSDIENRRICHLEDLWGSRTRPLMLTWASTRLARIR